MHGALAFVLLVSVFVQSHTEVKPEYEAHEVEDWDDFDLQGEHEEEVVEEDKKEDVDVDSDRVQLGENPRQQLTHNDVLGSAIHEALKKKENNDQNELDTHILNEAQKHLDTIQNKASSSLNEKNYDANNKDQNVDVLSLLGIGTEAPRKNYPEKGKASCDGPNKAECERKKKEALKRDMQRFLDQFMNEKHGGQYSNEQQNPVDLIKELQKEKENKYRNNNNNNYKNDNNNNNYKNDNNNNDNRNFPNNGQGRLGNIINSGRPLRNQPRPNKGGDNNFQFGEPNYDDNLPNQPKFNDNLPNQPKFNDNLPNQPKYDEIGPNQPKYDEHGPNQPNYDEKLPDTPKYDDNLPNKQKYDDTLMKAFDRPKSSSPTWAPTTSTPTWTTTPTWTSTASPSPKTTWASTTTSTWAPTTTSYWAPTTTLGWTGTPKPNALQSLIQQKTKALLDNPNLRSSSPAWTTTTPGWTGTDVPTTQRGPGWNRAEIKDRPLQDRSNPLQSLIQQKTKALLSNPNLRGSGPTWNNGPMSPAAASLLRAKLSKLRSILEGRPSGFNPNEETLAIDVSNDSQFVQKLLNGAAWRNANSSKLINWKIVNRGQQTIIVL